MEKHVCSGRTSSRFVSADLRPVCLAQVMITRGPPFGNRNVMTSFSDGVLVKGESRAAQTWRTHTYDHQSNFHASEQRSFRQDFCATVDGSIGTVSDSGMKAHCNWLVILTRVYIVWWMHVTIRKLQTLIPCGGSL